jgi:hypothetical protein
LYSIAFDLNAIGNQQLLLRNLSVSISHLSPSARLARKGAFLGVASWSGHAASLFTPQTDTAYQLNPALFKIIASNDSANAIRLSSVTGCVEKVGEGGGRDIADERGRQSFKSNFNV